MSGIVRRRRVISYALFSMPGGNISLYTDHLVSLMRAARALFPSWEIWIHHDEPAKKTRLWGFLQAMQSAGTVRLVPCGPHRYEGLSCLWRLKPLWESDVEYVIGRDCDSVQTLRDRKAVEQFILSNGGVHSISDNIAHTGVLIMGGMYGINAALFRDRIPFSSWEDFVGQVKPCTLSSKGTDQYFMSAHIVPKMADLFCEHIFHGEPSGKAELASWKNLDDAPTVLDVPLVIQEKSYGFTPYIGCASYNAEYVNKVLSPYDPPDIVSALGGIDI